MFNALIITIIQTSVRSNCQRCGIGRETEELNNNDYVRQQVAKTAKLSAWAPLTVLIAFGLLGVNGLLAAELSVEGQGGLDTNPHRLSSGLDPDIELFGLVDLRFSNRFDNGVSVKGRSKHAFYPDDDRADWSRTEFDLGYSSKFEIDDKKFGYRLSTDWLDRDKNYVSRTTGEDATFGGESIVDRYDYQQLNLNAEISYRTEARHRLRARYQRRDKDYEDYSIPGLSNFDYDHDRYRFDVRFQVADEHRLTVEYSTIDRKYDDRRIEDLDGDEIPGTDLEYDQTEYVLGYWYRPDQDFQFNIEFSFSDRSDNGVGYNDSSYDSVYLYWRKKVNETDEIRSSLLYSEFEYDNRIFSDGEQLEEELFENDGYLLKLDYKRKMVQQGYENLALIYQLQVDDYDSTDTRYRYDRIILSVGLRYNLL